MIFIKSIKRRRLEKEGLATPVTRLKLNDTIGHHLDKSKVISVLIFSSLWLVCTLALIFPYFSTTSEFYLIKDQQAPKTIYAQFDFNYLSKIGTAEKREQAKLAVPWVYKIDDAVSENILTQLVNALEEISKASNQNSNTPVFARYNLPKESITLISKIKNDKKRLELLKNKLSNIIYAGIIDKDAIIDNINFNGLKIQIINKNNVIRAPHLISTIPSPEEAVLEFSESVLQDYPSENSNTLKQAFYKIALPIIKPNLIQDKVLTEIERQKVGLSAKNDIYEYVTKGTQLVRKGEKVTLALLERYEAYENAKIQQNIYLDFWNNFLSKSFIGLIIISIMYVYFSSLHKMIIHSNQKMGIIATVITVSLFATYLSLNGFSWICSEYVVHNNFIICIIPLAVTPILLSVLIGLQGATFLGLMISMIISIKLDNLYIMIFGTAITCIASLATYKSKDYKEFFLRTIITIPLVFIPLEFFYLGKLVINDPNKIYTLVFLSLLNGFACGTISLASLFVIESVFQISTNMNLLTLCNHDHPLLRRLQMEAPGTYHHSLLVATLAEQAAKDIGANPIQARICALFHDIGKLSRPEYFSENNPIGLNLHNTLRPNISSIIIMNHIKDGVNLAIKYKLSTIIREAIEQHHGTDLIYFFYQSAIKNNFTTEGATVTEEEYKYPGPNPVSKEITLLSIADACEAASRSIEKPNAAKIESLVWDIIRKKIKGGQLDSTILTLEDLAKAKVSFTKTLTSMLHSRIKYPVDSEDESESDFLKTTQNCPNNR